MSKGTETKSRSDHAWAFWTARALAILLILGAASTMRSSPPTAPEPDLDVDSDNSNWPGGWPDRSQYEDDIEEISNDPQYPGKLIVVNDNDDDGDGIPDFADGFKLNGLWEDPYCRNDDANWSESDLVPLVLEVPEPVDLSVATICISYWDSNPLSCYSSGDPPVYTPSWGPIRIWRKDWPPRNPRSCKEWDYQWGTYGDYVRPDSYEPWQLGLSNGCRTTTLLIEGIRPSTQFGDTEILVYVDPDGCYGPQGFAYMDAVRVTCVRIDLDVDSDNTNGFELPARTDYEDQIEDAASKPELPGKFVQVNDNDDDGDGIPDFADGFNLDDEEDNEDDQTAGEKFVPLILEIPNPLWHLPDVAQNGEVTFTYSASDPALVTKDPATGAYSLPSPEHEWDPSFKLRIWRKNGNQPRNKNSAAATENPGDFIPTGTAIKLSALGLSAGTKIITLYVEALDHTTGTQPERIQVAFDPDGAPGPLPALCTDAVRVRCIRLEFVIPDSYDEETGVPNPNAGAVPTDFVGVSDPRPTVTLEEVSNSSVRLYGDHAEITLSGIVKDPIADNVPRGKVSEGRADIDSVAVYVDGQVYEDAVPLTPQDDGAASFWRQHPYKGTFNPITVNIPLEEGTHIIRVETSANAAGNTGFDEVAVTLEKRPIPLDLEGQEPPPPPTPVTETRGLWHFDTLMPPPPFAPEPLPFEPDWSTSLVFHLDTPGYAPDASGHGYDGSLSGSVATVEGGHFGSALLCPGGPYDFVEVSQGYGLDLATTDFTLEAWVQRWYDMYNMPHYGPQTIMGKSDIYNSGYALRIEEERLVLRLRLDYPTWGDVVIAGTTTIPPDAWTHVAACRAGDRVQLFVNGVPDSMGWVTLPAWSNVSATSEPFRVGATACMGYPNGDSFYGLLDEVRLSSTARYVPPERFTPDDSGQGNHAEIRAGDGLQNGALSLSGYAETPSSPALALGAADFTIEASVYYTWNTYGYLLSGPGYNITVDAEGRVSCSLYGADPPNPTLNLTAATTLGTYTWSQIALTRSGETVTLLIGGNPVASGTFQGALPAYPGPLDFGPSYPMDYGTAYLALDEVRISTTTTPPSGIYASIYIPADFDPEVADTIHYFHGLRDATAADPAFTESDTEPSSLLFRGTFQDVETTIAIDPGSFAGLSPNVDSFQATITHTFQGELVMLVPATFTKTGAQSNVFRAVLGSTAGEIPRAWVPWPDARCGSDRGYSNPMAIRVKGLPTAGRFRIRLGGSVSEIGPPAADGCCYLPGATPTEKAIGILSRSGQGGLSGGLSRAVVEDGVPRVRTDAFSEQVSASLERIDQSGASLAQRMGWIVALDFLSLQEEATGHKPSTVSASMLNAYAAGELPYEELPLSRAFRVKMTGVRSTRDTLSADFRGVSKDGSVLNWDALSFTRTQGHTYETSVIWLVTDHSQLSAAVPVALTGHVFAGADGLLLAGGNVVVGIAGCSGPRSTVTPKQRMYYVLDGEGTGEGWGDHLKLAKKHGWEDVRHLGSRTEYSPIGDFFRQGQSEDVFIFHGRSSQQGLWVGSYVIHSNAVAGHLEGKRSPGGSG